ncbi:DNA-binding IclR family transcriptional regulator [Paraburkholderia graminis]|uniref:DNA-binding IclR family transcriptional regulator n=2 Tax=Paraburkholderia graminis TaxID=60548 RepID=A0ABD5CN19_9BURK|nr:DNA-binding IclR family transcriptional regulator [Paraburkholderia graminis]
MYGLRPTKVDASSANPYDGLQNRTVFQMQADDADKGGVAALDRAFAILGVFQPGERALSLAEIARRTGFYKSTILRLLSSLERGGFIRRLDGNYSIGPEPLRLAQIFQESFHIREVIEPVLRQLSDDSGETSSFYVRQGEYRVVLHRVEPPRSVRVSIREGERFPIDRGASGKILIAFSKPSRATHDAVRERLWALSYGERDPDTAAVSVPVFGPNSELAGALTLSGPKDRLGASDKMRGACNLLLTSAARATAALGGDHRLFAYGIALAAQFDFALPGETQKA